MLHTFSNVYREMFLQVVAEYPGIGDMRLLADHEIRFLYDGLRPTLRRRTKA